MDVELEKTYLVKFLPSELTSLQPIELIDVYIPATNSHPTLRLRKKGDKYELTKKLPVNGDVSRQTEHTIDLSEDEFKALQKSDGKTIRKLRYSYGVDGQQVEIDVFQDNLLGLVLADFEFKNEEEQARFSSPGFCLSEVTQEEFIAGGYLASKSYQDIEAELEKFSYQKL